MTNTTITEVVPITLDELTKEVVDGDGVFDTLMRAAFNQLDNQYKKGVITKQQYSELHLQLITNILAQAIQFMSMRHGTQVAEAQLGIQEEQLGIQKEQLELEKEKLELQKQKAEKEVEVLDGQAEAFKTDALYKVAKLYADRWSVTATVDEATTADDLNRLGDNYIGSALVTLLNKVGVPIPPPIKKSDK